MRTIRDLRDAQLAITELLDWKERFQTKDLDLRQLRIRNAAPGVNPDDYVTVSQLPEFKPVEFDKTSYHTIVFSKDGVVSDTDIIPWYIVGRERDGVPVEVIVTARTAPSSGNLSINLQLNGNYILTDPIVLSSGQTGPIRSSSFINPLPILGYEHKLNPVILLAGGAGSVTVELVIRRD